MFRMQRTMLDQTEKAVETNLRLQRSAVHTVFGSLEATKSVQKSGLTLSKRAVEAYVNTLAEATPNERPVRELREAIDEQYAAADEIHDDAWEALSEAVDEGTTSYDELNEAQIELVQETFRLFRETQMDVQTATEDAVAEAERVAEAAAETTADVTQEAADVAEETAEQA